MERNTANAMPEAIQAMKGAHCPTILPIKFYLSKGVAVQFILVGLGGFFGAMARYGVVRWLSSYSTTFPFATLLVNVAGSFIVGVFATWIFQKTPLEGELRLAIQVGFLGALTTFSSFSLETMNLLHNGHVIKAFANIGLNLALCLIAVWLGVTLAKQLP